jgi:hypothetical protein
MDYLAPLRKWQGLQQMRARYDKPTPFAVPEYEDFAPMVRAMERMAVRIEELEGALQKSGDVAAAWVRRAMHLNPDGYLAEQAWGDKWEEGVREEIAKEQKATKT